MRIKANELRLGNLVNIEDIKNPCCISGIMENACMVYELKDFTIAYRYLKPIPITKKWLIRLGFEGSKTDFKKDGFLVARGVVYKRWSSLGLVRLSSEIKYVHQLQNLYFTLTNQELKLIKP